MRHCVERRLRATVNQGVIDGLMLTATSDAGECREELTQRHEVRRPVQGAE